MIEHPAGLVSAFADRMRETRQKAASDADDQATRFRRDIGPLGTALRLILGVFLVDIIVYGQMSTSGHLTPSTWLLGLLGFPALVLVWHLWRIRRNTARFSDTGPVSFLLSLALPLAVYFTGWYVRPLWFTSDATLIFVGSTLVLAALRGSAGCEFLALSWLAPAPDRPNCLRRLYTHRFPGAASLSLLISAVLLHQTRGQLSPKLIPQNLLASI